MRSYTTLRDVTDRKEQVVTSTVAAAPAPVKSEGLATAVAARSSD
jgi:hypothetical protein